MRSGDLRLLFSLAVTTYGSTEIALLQLMEGYDFAVGDLEQMLLEDGMTISWSQVIYKDVARFVGLDAPRRMRDIRTFELRRSRIPTSLFKSIAQDMDMVMTQYGPVADIEHEEAIFQFVSPIFRRLVSEFSFPFKNTPESVIRGCISMKGRTQSYFTAFGAVTVLIVVAKLKETERLDVIGQVIAECQGCGWINSLRNLGLPVYCILCDGLSFQFFVFDSGTKPRSFFRGTFPGDPPTLRKGLKLPNVKSSDTALPFIRSLRAVCETVFDVLLRAYISSVKAVRDQTVNDEGSLNKWNDAVMLADEALEMFRTAEWKRHNEERARANELVVEAMATLRHSVEVIPVFEDTKSIMNDWDDEVVEGS